MSTKPHIRNRYMLLGDCIFILASVFASYALRLELGPALLLYLPSAFWMAGVALLIKPVVYYLFGLYRRLWLYASIRELFVILLAVTAASIPVFVIMFSLLSLGIINFMPRTVFIIDWILSLAFVGGLRFSVRMLAEVQSRASNQRDGRARRILIVGAGDAGALVVRELKKNPQVNMQPVAFLDDDPAKQRQQIYDIPVIGMIKDLNQALDRHRIDEVIIAIPTAPGSVVRVVTEGCRRKGIPFRTMPGIYELLGGTVSVSRLRDVEITDLLRREPVKVKEELIGAFLSGRRVLVTGAGGSIGRELCRQIARWGPSELILLGHGENSIFETVIDLQDQYQGISIKPVIADVRDHPRLDGVFAAHRPEVVFHAAAHKHVPLMELNIEEAITNNILGTKNLVDLAVQYGVDRLVMISTDKAVRPANVMGATKRIAEMVVLDAGAKAGKPFLVVRFGNVLGSRGSVVPIFKRQIARGGPVTITHPDMERYFMTIPEAVYLVLQAAGMSAGGETFVLNMGQQVKILSLAEDLIRLSGLEPGKDIEIVFTGIRPGEKLREDLWEEGEYQPTDHPEIFQTGDSQVVSGTELDDLVKELVRLARQGYIGEVVALLDESIPDASVRATPPPQISAID